MPTRKSGWISALLISLLSASPLFAQGSSPQGLGGEVISDFKYLSNNALLDAEDIFASPLYVASANSPLRSPRFYLVLGGAGALWGGSFALDQTMRGHLRHMSSGDADLLQNISYAGVSASVGLLYGYGLWYDDARARHYALTAGEGAGIASLLAIALKSGFGRLRPRQDSHDHDAFFHGGASFVSADVAPMAALAAGVSEYYHNEWYVAAPVYSLALLDGFGRMGHDAHWFSDVVGAGLLGVATTELFIWLHNRHDEEPSRWRFFSETESASPIARDEARPDVGLGVAFDW